MNLAVVIINWNHHDSTWQKVQELKNWQSIKPEMIIVDNASRDRSSSIYQQLKEQTILIESGVNKGFAGGNNLGIKKALELGANYVMLLNTDVDLMENDTETLIRTLDQDREIGATGPVLFNMRSQKTYAGGHDLALHLDSRIVHDPLTSNSTVQDVDYVPGTVLVVRAALFDMAGPLDESYFFGGSVADWCRKIKTIGYRSCINTQVQATHRASDPDGLRSSLYIYYSLRNRFLFLEKWHNQNRKRLRRLWSVRCSRQLLGALAGGRLKKARAIWMALRDGRTGSFGNQNHLFISTGS